MSSLVFVVLTLLSTQNQILQCSVVHQHLPAFEGTDFKIDDQFDFITALAQKYNSTERDRFGLEDLFTGIANSSNPPLNVNVTDVLMAFNNLAEATEDKKGEFDINKVLEIAFPDPFPYIGETEHLPPEFISGVMSLIKDVLMGKKMDPNRITNFVLKVAGSTLDTAFKAMLGDVRYVAKEAVEHEHYVLEDKLPPSEFNEIKMNFSNPNITEITYQEHGGSEKQSAVSVNGDGRVPQSDDTQTPNDFVDGHNGMFQPNEILTPITPLMFKPITIAQRKNAIESVLKIMKIVQGMLSSVFAQLSAFLKTYMPQIASVIVQTLNAVLPTLVDALVKSTPSVLQLVGLLIATCPAAAEQTNETIQK